MLKFNAESVKLSGEWFVTSSRLSKSGNHTVACLAQEGLKGEMLQVLDDPSSLPAYAPGIRFTNPTVTGAVGADLVALESAVVPPKGTDGTQDDGITDPEALIAKGWMVFHPVYLLDADKVTKSAKYFGNAMRLLVSAEASAPAAVQA